MNFDFLKRNLGYKLLSLALAVLVYAWVYAQNRPNVSREEYIQPEIQGLPKDMVVKAGPPGAKVTVTGLLTAVEEFRGRQPKATIDLTRATPGANLVEVRYDTRGLNLDVVGPRRVTVVVDKKAERMLAVDIIPQNPAPAGLEYSNKVAEPSKVQISGLASEVSKVVKLVAIVPNNPNDGAKGTFSGPVELIAQAANDAVIDSVTIAPARVTARPPSIAAIL
jgi:YbbR domain-containing protein